MCGGGPIPQQPTDFSTKAADDLRAGNYTLAAGEYERLVKVNPRSPELWSNLGAAQTFSGNCHHALDSLAKARALNPALFAPWYFSGLCHLQLHQEESSATELKRAISINPKDPNAWYLLAQAEGNLGQLGASFSALVRVLSLDPTRPEGYYQGGKTALDLAAACYVRVGAGRGPSAYAYRLGGERDAVQGAQELAITSYQKAAELSPRDPDIHFALGSIYLEEGKLPEAEAELRKCLDLLQVASAGAPTVWTRLRLAVVLARENKLDEAKGIIESLDPTQFEVSEEFEDALTCATLFMQTSFGDQILKLALQRFPDDPAFVERESRISSVPGADARSPGLTSVGSSLRFVTLANAPQGNFVAGFFESPREYHQFREAFLHNNILGVAKMLSMRMVRLPAEPAHAFVLGEVLHWISFGLYQRLGTSFPESEAAQMLAAENFASSGQQDKAIEIYQAMLDKDRSSRELLRALAKIYWTQGRWDEAIKVFQSLLDVDPYDSTTLVNVGRIYSYRQDLEKAEANFRRAAELDAKLFEAHLGLGETLRRKGEIEGALRELKIASQLDPANPRPHYALSQVYRKLDEKQNADVEMKAFERLQANAAPNSSQAADRFVPVE